jgi:hypothetical protein
VGVRARGSLWITSAVEIPGPSGPGHYAVPAGATQPTVEAARAADPRIGYLGEWHSHDSGGSPSRMDRRTMRDISFRLPRPPGRGPLLAIVCQEVGDWNIYCYQARWPQLVPAGLTAAGPLPPPPPERTH